MSQFDWGVIDPNAKSGSQLALDLNNFRDALNSLHRGISRPPYVQAGMLWIREVTTERWDVVLHDGQNDLVLRSLDPTISEVFKFPTSEVDGLDDAIAIALKKDAATTTGAALIPGGSPAQRPSAPENGMFRYNSTIGAFEGFQAGSWKPVAGKWGEISGNILDQSDLQAVLATLKTTYGGAPVALSGQQSVVFSGIPSWARQVKLNVWDSAGSANGASSVRVGVASGPVTSGYMGVTANHLTASASTITSTTDEFWLNPNNTTLLGTGSILLTKTIGGDGSATWIVEANFASVGVANVFDSRGRVSIPGDLSQIELKRVTAGQTFSAGFASVFWE